MRNKKSVLSLMLIMAMVLSLFQPTVTHAAKKKLTVKKVYTTSTKIKGKTKKNYQVRVKIRKKTYRAKAKKKGNFSIKIPKQKKGKKLTIKVYRKKKGKWKYYTKKTVKVAKRKTSKYTKNGKPYYGEVPGRYTEINLDKFLKDYNNPKVKYEHSICDAKTTKYIYANYIDSIGSLGWKTAAVGDINHVLDICGYGDKVTIEAMRGVTLYYTCVGYGEPRTPDLSDYDGVIRSGEMKTIKHRHEDISDVNNNKYEAIHNLRYKIHGYYHGKLVLIEYGTAYLF